jgi:hypothetical protein
VSTKYHFQDRKVRKENTSNIVRVYLQGLNDYESMPVLSSKMLFMLLALQQVKLSSLTKPLWSLLPGSRGVDEIKMVGADRLQMRLRKLEERNWLKCTGVVRTQANCLK